MVGQDHIGIRERGRWWLWVRRNRARRSSLPVRRGIVGHLCGHGCCSLLGCLLCLACCSSAVVNRPCPQRLFAGCRGRVRSVARPSSTCCVTALLRATPQSPIKKLGFLFGISSSASVVYCGVPFPAIVCKTARSVLGSTRYLSRPGSECGCTSCVYACCRVSVWCWADWRLVRFALEESTTKWQLCFLSHSRSLPLAHFLSFKVTELLTVGACRVVRTVRDG